MQMRQEPQLIHNNELTKNEDIEALDTTLLKLNTENTILKQNNNTFKQEIEMLNKGFETFNEDKKTFKEVIKTLKKEIETLKEDNKAFNEKWNNFEESLKRLKQKNIQENATPQTEPVWTEQTKPPSDVSFIHLEPMASVTKVILKAIAHQPDGETTPYDLLGTIIEQLQKHIPAQTVGTCQTYDLDWKLKDGMWFYLLYEFPETDASGEKDGLLFIASGVNTSSKVFDYFKGCTVFKQVKRVLEPAHVKVGASLPPTVVSHGTVESPPYSARGKLPSMTLEPGDPCQNDSVIANISLTGEDQLQTTLRDNSENAKIGLSQEPRPTSALPPEKAIPDPYKPAKREAIATAILLILNNPEFNQATAEDLNSVITEKLAAIFDTCPGVCRFYDYSFGKQVSGAMWHYLLLLYPASPQPTHGLLFVALEVNYSARHSKYFDGGLEHQTVSKLTQPAYVAWNEDVPPKILQKGILKTSARA